MTSTYRLLLRLEVVTPLLRTRIQVHRAQLLQIQKPQRKVLMVPPPRTTREGVMANTAVMIEDGVHPTETVVAISMEDMDEWGGEGTIRTIIWDTTCSKDTDSRLKAMAMPTDGTHTCSRTRTGTDTEWIRINMLPMGRTVVDTRWGTLHPRQLTVLLHHLRRRHLHQGSNPHHRLLHQQTAVLHRHRHLQTDPITTVSVTEKSSSSKFS
mmetsp:Transcript_22549/g.90386  ORF Transcript_22549/g.90386 Transcript_22549/m.90386 type:complete len:210 (+) Transcript_22549:1027-1656(+)